MHVEVLDGTNRKAIVISFKTRGRRDYESKLLISYKTPVAFVIDGSGFVTNKTWSRTTSTHIRKFLSEERVETHSVVSQSRVRRVLSSLSANLDELNFYTRV